MNNTNTELRKLIIIPAYNESENLCELISEIQQKASTYDYVVINDGSSDDTKKICKANKFNAIHLPVNLGIGGAVQTGYLYAKENDYDIAIQIDGDGQHDPAFLDTLIESIVDGNADLTLGSRFINKKGFQSTKMRQVGILWLSLVLRLLTGNKIKDVTSGFRAANKAVISDFCHYYPYDYPEPETLCVLSKKNIRTSEVPVEMRSRNKGKSSIRLFKSVYYVIKVTLAMIIAFFPSR